MEGQSYTQKAYKEIYFSNSDVSFEFFYNNLATVLKDLNSELNLYVINKKLFSFIGNFIHAIDTDERKEEIRKLWLDLYRDLENDEELKRLVKRDSQNIDIQVPYIQKYYGYFIRQIKLLSLFLSSLDRTYMPTTDLSKSLFRWKNYLQFFNSYIAIKQEVTNNLGSFSILRFQVAINSILVFYYAYSQYVTLETRDLLEKSLTRIISFVSELDFLKLVTKEYKTSMDLETLDKLKWPLNHILLQIYDKINNEHSIYNIIPKIQKKVYIDSTNM